MPSQLPPLGSAPASRLRPPTAAAVPCFSFGANMAPSVLAKRGVRPLASEPAVVEDPVWALSFSHRGGYATLTRQPVFDSRDGESPPPFQPGPAAGPCWRRPHGVLHVLEPADLQRLTAKEVGYSLGRLSVVPYGSNQAVAAAVFLSSPLLRLYRPVPPPERYRSLLLEGARHHGLAFEYLAWLEGLEALPAGQPMGSEYDACPADSLAKLLAAGAAGAIAWASAHGS